jgi:hypothetical protein
MTRTFALLTGATIILGSVAIVPPADAAMRCFGHGRSHGYCGYGYSPGYTYPYGYGPSYTYPPTRAYPYRPGHPYEFDRQLSGRD